MLAEVDGCGSDAARALPADPAGRALAGDLLRGADGRMLSLSLQQGDVVNGFRSTWHWQNYIDGVDRLPARSSSAPWCTALITTVVLILLAYPMAYWIAFHGGARKSTYLFLILLPFFVSFVLRTISWQFLLADDGIAARPAEGLGLLPQDFHVLGTPFAVVGGLTYNFLPFMVLPIYVALERIDPRVIEAAHDLYATRLPGVPQGGVPAVAAGCLRRRAHDVRAGQLRLRQRAVLGGTGDHHDRQHHPDAVSGQLQTTRRPPRCRSR